jgi:hypothetical protein
MKKQASLTTMTGTTHDASSMPYVNSTGVGLNPALSHTRNYSRWDYNGEVNISATAIVSPGTAAVVNASPERYSVSVV